MGRKSGESNVRETKGRVFCRREWLTLSVFAKMVNKVPTEPSFLLSEKEVTKKARREGENEPFRTDSRAGAGKMQDKPESSYNARD